MRTRWPRATPAQLDQCVNGPTLYQQVLALKRQFAKDGKKIGPLTKRRLAKEYNLQGSTGSLVVPPGS
eukprot:11162852-Lingulodinium_polyedra.AAC.1